MFLFVHNCEERLVTELTDYVFTIIIFIDKYHFTEYILDHKLGM